MRTTLDIPDALYREFKAKTAINGEKMRDEIVFAPFVLERYKDGNEHG